jgi:lysosomal Pro-X carboxypeptidase
MPRLAYGLPVVQASAPSLQTLLPSDGYSTFAQPCNHDDWSVGAPTLEQRYLLNSSFWQPGGPLLFYAGNEGPIEDFVQATGAMWTLAQEVGAIVLFAEHRGYGGSLTTNCSDGYRSVSSAAALADFAALAASLRGASSALADATLVAIGGSYGGMLACWLRLRYAHIFDGALAASAPIVLGAAAPSAAIYEVTSRDFACAKGIGGAFRALWLNGATEAGRAEIASSLGLCKPPPSRAAVEALIGRLQQALFTFAQLDYPYKATFGAISLPASPVSVACGRFEHNSTALPLLRRLGAAVSLLPALDPSLSPSGCVTLAENATFEATLPGFVPGAWSYQRCSEIVLPYEATAATSPLFLPCSEFAPNCWDAKRFAAWCNANYGVQPSASSATIAYGGRNVRASGSRIVFTNGDRDPWSACGVTAADVDPSRDLLSIRMHGAAHHLDLRAPNKADPADVVAARALQTRMVKKWVSEGRRWP